MSGPAMWWARAVIASSVLVLCACSQESSTPTAAADHPKAIPAQAVVKVLTGGAPAPTPVLDTKARQVALGTEGGLGPTDYAFFGAIRIAPADLPRWTEHWTRMNGRMVYDQPPTPIDWWPTPSAFDALEFYAPRESKPGQAGYVGVDRKTHTLYFSHTTS